MTDTDELFYEMSGHGLQKLPKGAEEEKVLAQTTPIPGYIGTKKLLSRYYKHRQ